MNNRTIWTASLFTKLQAGVDVTGLHSSNLQVFLSERDYITFEYMLSHIRLSSDRNVRALYSAG